MRINRKVFIFVFIIFSIISVQNKTFAAVVGDICPELVENPGQRQPNCEYQTQNPIGCDFEDSGGCGPGLKCSGSEDIWICVEIEPGDQTNPQNGECTFLMECGARSGGCDAGSRCVYETGRDDRTMCFQDDTCEDEPGTEGYACRMGFDRCDPGLVCVNGICIVNTSGDDKPYERTPGQPYGGNFLSLENLMQGIFKILYPVAIILGVLFFVKGGYSYMVSEGDPQKVKAAQGEITNAILGTLFVLLSAAILRIIISSVLGLPIGL